MSLSASGLGGTNVIPSYSLHCLKPLPSLCPVNRENRNKLMHLWSVNQRQGLLWWLSGKESACQYRRYRFHLWVRMIPWRRRWQPSPIFLPGKSHGQRSLVSISPRGCKIAGHDLVTKQQSQSSTKETRINNGEKTVSSIRGAGKTGQLHVK